MEVDEAMDVDDAMDVEMAEEAEEEEDARCAECPQLRARMVVRDEQLAKYKAVFEF